MTKKCGHHLPYFIVNEMVKSHMMFPLYIYIYIVMAYLEVENNVFQTASKLVRGAGPESACMPPAARNRIGAEALIQQDAKQCLFFHMPL